jgi:hypothetical protein
VSDEEGLTREQRSTFGAWSIETHSRRTSLLSDLPEHYGADVEDDDDDAMSSRWF